MVTYWATFCLSKSISFSPKIGTFKTWFLVGTLRFQKWFDVDILDFQIVLCYFYLGIFLVYRLFGLLFEKLGNFLSKTSGHPEQ
jgi:hypothetical protein